MDWKKYDKLPTGAHIRNQIRANDLLSLSNYDGSKLIDDKTWSVSEFVQDSILTRSSFVARCMLFGETEKGQKDLNNPNPVCNRMTVKIRVLSRQGCSFDAEGNEINVRPKELDECMPHDTKPLPGDKVCVKDGMKTVDELDKPYEGPQRNRDILRGKSIYHETVYTVDENLCIDVSLKDAFTLLKKNGKRLVQPEFKPRLSNLNRDERKLERKIANWLYEEVGQSFELEETKNKKAAAKKQAEKDKELIKKQAEELKRLKKQLKLVEQSEVKANDK